MPNASISFTVNGRQVSESELSNIWPVTDSGLGAQGASQRGGGNIQDIGLQGSSILSAFAGGLEGALQGNFSAIQAGITGALNSAIASSGVADVLNNAASQFGAVLPGVSELPALGGTAPAGETPAATQTTRPTTIEDATGSEVTITTDSFLQSLQGSLSDITSGGDIGNVLGGALQNLLSSTGIVGALSGIVEQIGPALSSALGGLTQALGTAVQELGQGLGNVIQNIPGVGPALGNMSNAISNFSENISGAFANLPEQVQQGINGIASTIGTDVINGSSTTKISSLNPTDAETAASSLEFNDNPAAQLNQIATTARNLDKLIFGETKSTAFANVASAASKASKEIANSTQRNENGNYELIQDPDQAGASIDRTQIVTNGELQPASNTFVENLNSIQLQSYQTYDRILQSRFSIYGGNAPDLATQAYREYIEFESLRTPETKLFINQIDVKDSQLIKQLADRFLTFYRSSRSRYSLENL